MFLAPFRPHRSWHSAVAHLHAQVVLLGMEPSSHYFENLARHLLARPLPVTLINSFAVTQNRDQHSSLPRPPSTGSAVSPSPGETVSRAGLSDGASRGG